MPESAVEAIFITDKKDAPMTPVAEANACAGLGLEGDRHYRAQILDVGPIRVGDPVVTQPR